MVVGSANVSSHSAKHLLEAAIFTRDKTIVRDVEKFINENCIEKIELDYIELCKQNCKPPKNFEAKRRPRVKNDFKGQLSRLWVIYTTPYEFTDDENDFLEKDERTFKGKISNKRIFELTEIQYPIKASFINQVQEGDLLIEIYNYNNRASVIQPKRALGVSFSKAKGTAYLRVEERKKPLTKSWTNLERQLQKNHIKGITKKTTKEIKNENTKKYC